VTSAAALKPSGLQAAVAVSVPKLKDDEWLAKFLTVVVTAEEVGLRAVLLHTKLAEPAPPAIWLSSSSVSSIKISSITFS
jgi:membrane protease YdiL (CAAX protease family)